MVGQTVDTGVARAVAVKLAAPGPLGELSTRGVEVLDAVVPLTSELHRIFRSHLSETRPGPSVCLNESTAYTHKT